MYIEENTNLNKEDLNIIYIPYDNIYPKPYYIKVVDIDTYMDKYDGSVYFRTKLLEKDYKIITLYNVYHQGWECDQYSAIVEKDNKKYYAETDHGTLHIREYKKNMIEKVFDLFKIKT